MGNRGTIFKPRGNFMVEYTPEFSNVFNNNKIVMDVKETQ